MALFSYSAYAASGEIKTGTLEAASQADVVDDLGRRGLTAFDVSDASSASTGKYGRKRGGPQLSLNEYALLASELATLLHAGLPIHECLNLVITRARTRKLRNAIAALKEAVLGGAALSAAIAEHLPSAPSYYASLMRAGESRGDLAGALDDLATFLEERIEIRNELRAALTYPAILGLIALAAIGIVIGVLVPNLMPMFDDTGVEPPWTLQIANRLAVHLGAYWQIMLIALCGAVLLLKFLFRRGPFRTFLDHAKLRVPVIGTLHQKAAVASISRTLGTLLQNGEIILPALRISATVTENAALTRAVQEAALRVKEGEALSDSLRRTNTFPDLALRFIAIGEETGKLGDMLLRLARIYDKEVSRQISALMTVLAPVMTVVIGIVVGGLILSVMQALLSINELIAQ